MANTLGKINPFRYRGYVFDEETGLYYLQSRYYDPQVGRFINLDSRTDNSAGVLSNNLFLYVANNPIIQTDPSGHGILKNVIKWTVKNIVKPITKTIQKVLAKVPLTYSKGSSIGGSLGVSGFTAQGGYSVDTKGNIAIQCGYTTGSATTSPSLSVTQYETITMAPSVDKLAGKDVSDQIGISGFVPILAALGPVIGVAINIIPDSNEGKTYYGKTVNKGFAVTLPDECIKIGIGGSFDSGETVTLVKINIFDIADDAFQRIMEW